jgi:isopentenyl-diphosphate delta-isomerase
MIEANALQVHLNVAQEISMPEGDADFSGWLRQIESFARYLPVPIIVKETGCGMAGEQIRALASVGVRAIDVGGSGGTNFIAIESARSARSFSIDQLEWGIPTAISALEAAEVLPRGVDMIVSGGVRSPLDALKSFAVGAVAVGMAAPVLRKTEAEGVDAAVNWLQDYLETLKKMTMLLGRRSIKDVATQPMVISGRVAQWMDARKISIQKYACRSI